MSKIYELPEDGQQLRPKHAGAFINKRKIVVQQVGVKFHVFIMMFDRACH